MSSLPKMIFAACTGAVLAFACTVGTGMDDVAKADVRAVNRLLPTKAR